MAAHPDLEAEQAHIDHAYRRLDAMRANAESMLREAFAQAGGTFQAITERDVIVRTSLNRLEQLQLGREALVFGRIDQAAIDGHGPEAFHIGRLAVSDEDQEPLVVDWRAPVAEPFYRATGRHPMGLARRRHFITEGRTVTGIEDEIFSPDGGTGDDHSLAGPGALLAALERSRSGHMRDIVATVQREQDEIIRAPLAGVLVVQGGPGTGKTAVALHRAAYLLYTHRFPLERQGVLVLGPNPLFLRYIEHVLPSLGESGADMTTVSGLVLDAPVSGRDRPETARLKGDPRMVRFIRRAIQDRQRPLRHDLVVGYGPHTLRMTAAESADLVASVRRRPGSHNARRRQVETLLFRRLHAVYEQAEERIRRTGLRPPRDDDPELADLAPTEAVTPADLARALRRHPDVVEALDRMWPVLTPQQLLHDLFGAPPLIALAGRRLLSERELTLLERPRSATVAGVAWTDADMPLLDEARAFLGTTRRRPAPPIDPSEDGRSPDELRTYGHIVVDEAQDLSPMQLRMLSRRSLSGSMTIVGDVGQATGHWAPASWDDVLAHLPTRRGKKVVELTVNYRTPAEIMELAGRVLAAAAPGMQPPDSVRSTGDQPVFVRADDAGALGASVVDAVREELQQLGGGTIAVICAPSHVEALEASFDLAGIEYGEPNRTGLDAQVTLVPVDVVKGLEFDGVVVIEPARIAGESPQGLRALYVALTRATRRLAVVHTEPLPPPLTAASN